MTFFETSARRRRSRPTSRLANRLLHASANALAIRELDAMNDHLLEDIGLTRDSIRHAVRGRRR